MSKKKNPQPADYLFGVLYPTILQHTGEINVVHLDRDIRQMYKDYDIVWNGTKSILKEKPKESLHNTLKRYFNALIFWNDPRKPLSFSKMPLPEKMKYIEFVKAFALHEWNIHF